MGKRTVVVTGASTSVGQACARRFSEAGDRLVLADRDDGPLRVLADELKNKGQEATFVVADPSNRLQVHNIVAEALEAYGRIDILVHADLLIEDIPFLEAQQDEFDRMIEANLKGVFVVNQAVARQLVKQQEDPGSDETSLAIVNMLSVESVTASADRVVFAASQGGAHQMTKAIALALSPYGIRANAVGFGAIKGEIVEANDAKSARSSVPLNRIGDPAEVADAAFFLASDSASYITGQTLYVDGGRLVRSSGGEKKKSTGAL